MMPRPHGLGLPRDSKVECTNQVVDDISEVSTTVSDRASSSDASPSASKWTSVQARKKPQVMNNKSLASSAAPAVRTPVTPCPCPTAPAPKAVPSADAKAAAAARSLTQAKSSKWSPKAWDAKSPEDSAWEAKAQEKQWVAKPQASSSYAASPSAQSTRKSYENAAGGKTSKGLSHFQRIEVGIEDDREFRVVQKLIGPKGKHMQDIVTTSKGAKVWIIGRGSRSWEDDVGPLTVCVGASAITVFDAAVECVQALLARVRTEKAEYAKQ